MTEKTRRHLRLLAVVAATGLAMGLAVGVLRFSLLGHEVGLAVSLKKGGLLGLLLSASIYSLEYLALGPRVRRYAWLAALGIKTAVYAVVVAAVYLGVSALFTAEMSWELQLRFLAPAFGISVGTAFLASVLFMVQALLGKGVFTQLVSGRYHHPREEQLVFLFLDLVGSTAAAERIGPLAFHRFLNEFFCDLDGAITGHGGEIYKYVGDELIAVWRPRGREPARFLAAWRELTATLSAREPEYRARYGLVPEFRLGLHAGPAVTGEMGDSRKEIAYLGDTVNTASRILSACKDFKRPLLLSAEALVLAELPQGLKPVRVGRVVLRGKKKSVELFGLDPSWAEGRGPKSQGPKKRGSTRP